jgi:hypothetical protein
VGEEERLEGAIRKIRGLDRTCLRFCLVRGMAALDGDGNR